MTTSLENLIHSQTRYAIANKWQILDAIAATQAPPTHVRCELCGWYGGMLSFKQLHSECIFGGGRLQRFQCPSCEVVFGASKMLQLTERELSTEYESHYQVYSEGDSTDAEVKAFFALNPEKGKCYLNFGTGGWSKSVPHLRENGWNVLGFEPHASAVVPGSESWLIRDWGQLRQFKFEGLFTNNVLEHFRHPVQALQQMREILQPHALMSHATPCYEYLFEYTRFHLFFFVGGSRHVLFQKAGLKEVSHAREGEYMCSVVEPA